MLLRTAVVGEVVLEDGAVEVCVEEEDCLAVGQVSQVGYGFCFFSERIE